MKNWFANLTMMAFASFLLAACGDDSGTVSGGLTKLSNADMEVDSYSQLPSCAEKRVGKTAYVADQDQGYVCQNGKWVESDAVETNNSSSLNSSGSVKSSSSINGSCETAYQVEVVNPGNVKKGTMTDSRDGKTYKTVTIGSQTWMAENLNYEAETAYSICYNYSAIYCAKYGLLYSWQGAANACPAGWHLPTKVEFETLFTEVGGQSTAGKVLRSTSGWNSCGNGTDTFGFSALPAGYRFYVDGFYSEGYLACFWSSTEGDHVMYSMCLHYNLENADLVAFNFRQGLSVRCLRD